MSKSRVIAWIAWILASIFYSYQYILRVMPNIMLDDIITKFQMNTQIFGHFSGIYYIGYCAAHIPVGIMLDRYGPKKVMPICILISVLGMIPLIWTNFYVYPIIGRMMIGIGSSAAILSVFKVIRLTFSEVKFTRMLTISVTIGLIGAIYGGGPVSYMKAQIGYEKVIIILMIIGVILSAISYIMVPNTEKTNSLSVFKDIADVFSNIKVILVCCFAGLMIGPMEGFADVWGTTFFEKVYGMDKSIAASLPSIIFIGMCFGGPILSIIAEKIKSQLWAIVSAGIFMTAIFALLIQTILSSFNITLVFIVVGICSAYQILAIYKASTYVREEIVGLTTAVANMIIMLFGYFFHGIIGTIINKMGGIESSVAIKSGIAVIPIALFIGTCGFIFIAILDRKMHKKVNRKSLIAK